MTPLLIMLFGIHPITAVGTDLLFAAATKSVGTLVNGFHRTVAWRVTGLLATGSLPSAAAALFLVSRMNLQEQATSQMIRGVLSAVLLLTALSLVGRPYVMALPHTRLLDVGPRGSAVLTVTTGTMKTIVVVGMVVSLTSIGAGAVGINGLLLLYPPMPIARIVASDIAHAMPLTLLAGVGHWIMGSVNWPMLRSVLIGSVPGGVLGS